MKRVQLIVASVVALLAFYAVGNLAAQTTTSTNSQGSKMRKTFVFIFRQGSRTLSAEEQKQRTEEVRAWALEQIKQGRNLEPRVLGNESYRLGEQTSEDKGDGVVIALNFIEANDLAEAVSIAKTHPGLRYGVRIEVRPWTDPRAPQPR
jgi:hypothetical protein